MEGCVCEYECKGGLSVGLQFSLQASRLTEGNSIFTSWFPLAHTQLCSVVVATWRQQHAVSKEVGAEGHCRGGIASGSYFFFVFFKSEQFRKPSPVSFKLICFQPTRRHGAASQTNLPTISSTRNKGCRECWSLPSCVGGQGRKHQAALSLSYKHTRTHTQAHTPSLYPLV